MRLVLGLGVASGITLVLAMASGYELFDGTYSAPTFHGTFTQWGGTASVSAITHQMVRAFHDDDITIHQGAFYSGEIDCSWLNGYFIFTQNGGLHLNSNGIVLASSADRFVNRGSSYTLNGGVLRSPSFAFDGGLYSQKNGTNIAGSFAIGA